ncbi:transmembrane anchored protein [Agrobacterium vitis]|nr:transmembrane anchored protein [Allorhizobium ampelinum]MCF1446530.1 transmembrane anchored protein [Allorhizobium ampelinum]
MRTIILSIMVLIGMSAVSYASCNQPDDRASDGSRCGGRAASERPGGKS